MTADIPSRTAFGAFDLGTTNLKAALLQPDGRYEDLGSVPNPVHVESGGRAVCRASETLAAFTELLSRMAASCRTGNVQTLHIGLCAHIPSLIVWDTASKRVVHDEYPIWLDTTSRPSVPAVREFLAGGRDFELLDTCLPVVANWLAVKIHHHLGETVPEEWRILQVHDYLYFLLTDCFETHFSGQVSIVNYRSFDYPDTVLSFLNIGRGNLPTIVPDSCRSFVDPLGIFASLGLPADTRVHAGLADRSAGFCGMDLQDRDGILLASTSDNAGTYYASPQPPPERLTRVPHGDGWVHYGSTTAGGSTLQWFLERLAGTATLEALSSLAENVSPGSEGLFFHPYLAGERAPLWNEAASASFVGLRNHHRKEHLFRAVLEGVAFGKRALFEALGSSMPESAMPKRVKVAGGGARNDLQNRIRASILGTDLEVYTDAEFPLRGLLVRLLSACDVEAASVLPPLESSTVAPVASWRARYEELYPMFLRVQEAQKCVWDVLAQ